jgi:hypothetical protein
MSAGAVRDALLRAVLARPIIADTTEDVRTFWSNASAAKCRARRFRPRCRRSSRRDWCTNRYGCPGRAAMPLELSLRGQEAAVTSETD